MQALRRRARWVAALAVAALVTPAVEVQPVLAAPPVVDGAQATGTPAARSADAVPTGGSAVAADVSPATDPATAEGLAVTPTGKGLWIVDADASVVDTGDASSLGAASGGSGPAVGIAATRSGKGYWLADASGAVIAAGDAPALGAATAQEHTRPIVGIAATPNGGGYWLVAADGGVSSFGNARFKGSTGAIHLSQPIVGIAATPDGAGYWLVAADGGVFSFGNARFKGSTGAIHLNQPIVGIAATPDGGGYWLVAADGGVFSFGDARFEGSTGGRASYGPVTAIAATPDGGGYWILAFDGSVAAFGDAAPIQGAGTPRRAYPVGSQMIDVTDPNRATPSRGGAPGHAGRDLPTMVLYPAALNGTPLAGPRPLVVFAHGFATTPNDYLSLLQAWAADGYVVAAPFLPGERGDLPGPVQSDRSQEPSDLSAVISAVLSLGPPSPLAGLADGGRIAVAGHSDGGMAVAAMALEAGHADPRVKAALILSGDVFFLGGSYGATGNVPVLIAQGTADPVNNPAAAGRLWAVARAPRVELRILGAGHLPPYVTAGRQQDTVRAATADFLDAELLGSRAGLTRLAYDGNTPGLTSLVVDLG